MMLGSSFAAHSRRRAPMVTNPTQKTIARRVCLPPLSEFSMLADPCRRTCERNAMGHRLSKIVTRTGDAGTTGLGDGTRVAKDSARIEAIGEVDELKSTLGLLLSETLSEPCAAVLIDVQHDLFDLGGELSIPGHFALT